MLREVDLDMLMGFHEVFDLDNSDNNNNSSSRSRSRSRSYSESIYQERSPIRSFVVNDSDSLEYVGTSDEHESSDDDQPVRHRIRSVSRRKSNRSHTERVKQTPRFDLTTPPVTQQKGPMAAVPYYTNAPFVERHWIDCLKCKGKGYPNGPPPNNGKRKGSQRQQRHVDDIFEMTPEEEEAMQGRLLLCITCTAAVHEGCLATPHKRFLRDCIENDKEHTEFQCALCIAALSNKPDCIPACDVCHQVHSIADLKLLPKSKTSVASPSTSSDLPLSDTPSPAQTTTTPDTTDDHPIDSNGLFRCSVCRRAFHDTCIPAIPDAKMVDNDDILKGAYHDTIIQTCLDQQKCTECMLFNKKVEKIVTWRIAGEPADKRLDITFNDASKETKEYLVKWVDTSYCHLTWVPEEWIMRTSKQLYSKYCERVKHHKHATQDDLIPKAWKTVERILTAVDRHGNTITKGPARRVDKMLVKFNDLTYDEGNTLDMAICISDED